MSNGIIFVYEKVSHKKWAGGCCYRHEHESSFENEFVKFLTSSQGSSGMRMTHKHNYMKFL